jgi:hypothetical protein
MAKVERIREVVKGPLSPAYVSEREEAGWRLVCVEWEREAETETQAAGELADLVPYGLRVAEDCTRLAENPAEMGILRRMMELIIRDVPFFTVAAELNQQGYRTRRGTRWSPISVFNMLPRLIEVGPQMFTSKEWVEHRRLLWKHVWEG